MTDEVRLHTHGAVGHISLNRPKALHALTQAMCEAMSEALLAWREDDHIEAVMIDHAEGRGFCAGGDIGLLRRSALEDGGVAGRAFFHAEYRLNHLLFTFPKPVIAFMDGVTMGGGVGISQPARYRIATENTRFAMPESGIGLFPDVGGGWYLSRLPGRAGPFLALTGARLGGAECLHLGIATHFLPSGALGVVKARIIAEPGRIEALLSELSIDPPAARIADNIDRINTLFAWDRYEEILAALEAEGSDWSRKELQMLSTKCPTTCKVALRQLSESAQFADFADNMRMEYRIAGRMLVRADFAEGVRAMIVDKTGDPQWNPATAEGASEEMLDAIFAPLPQDEEWTPQ